MNGLSFGRIGVSTITPVSLPGVSIWVRWAGCATIPATVHQRLVEWTVEYGADTGEQPISVPHAWCQDVPISWEGPATYRTRVSVPSAGGWLLFRGVAYASKVSVEGEEIARHEGMWDAFSADLCRWAGRDVELQVEVVKAGGSAYPVREVAAGFLPFVYHTFGGIYQDVTLYPMREDPRGASRPIPDQRVEVRGGRVHADGKPFYMRGVLHWGWYPGVGHTNPSEEQMRAEAKQVLALGFNTLKCCLWVPTHRHLEILAEEGLWVWMELPLWDPSPAHLDRIGAEIERVVEQYRHHDNILCWTLGCELSEGCPPGFRQRMVERTRALTDSPLVTDNSGSAEMYGGDPREFGDFYDFHPYCDTPFFPTVLDALLPGARAAKPLFLGEFNDHDTHRDLARLKALDPYWASADEALNAQGVRWQYDLPGVLATNRFADPAHTAASEALAVGSQSKRTFVRKVVQEAVRSRPEISGYVVTGWSDTPISTSGMVDDHGLAVPKPGWNGPDCLFVLPRRRPPWVRGGNRPGWVDPFTHFDGPVALRVGLHSEAGCQAALSWSVVEFAWRGNVRPRGRVAQMECEAVSVEPLDAREIGDVFFEGEPGGYLLRARFGQVEGAWPVWIVSGLVPETFAGWSVYDPRGRFDGVTFGGGDGLISTRLDPTCVVPKGPCVCFLDDGPVVGAPFWRESAFEFLDDAFWSRVGYKERWERLLSVSGDCVLDMDALRDLLPGVDWQVLMNRVDVRTYAEAPVLVRGTGEHRRCLITTLRPDGGLGAQPLGVPRNPSGVELMRQLCATVVSDA